MIVGFSWGGWVTGGTARATAETMAHDAVVTRLAPICVVQSGRDPAKAVKLVALKDESSWQRGEYVGKQGWATMPGEQEPDRRVAEPVRHAAHADELVLERRPRRWLPPGAISARPLATIGRVEMTLERHVWCPARPARACVIGRPPSGRNPSDRLTAEETQRAQSAALAGLENGPCLCGASRRP